MGETVRVKVISMFLRFLAEKKLLQEFVDNTHKSLGQATGLERLLGDNPYFWVMDAFTWENTKEGSDIWREVDKAWRYIVEHNNWD